jgi:hypothetical protein
VNPRGRLAIIVGSLALTSAAHAFWSYVSTSPLAGKIRTFAHHQDYTNNAIGSSASFVYAGQSYKFTQAALDAISLANMQVDMENINPYKPQDHFDGETFGAGVAQIAKFRSALMTDLSWSSSLSPSDQSDAWARLGAILHAVQDFYAHSTWVEEGHTAATDIVHFKCMTGSTCAPQVPLIPTPGSICGSGGYPLLSSSFTSGYYSPNSIFDPAPPGRCWHGTLADAVLTCASPSALAGISKDSPCAVYFPPGQSNSHFIAAAQATQETLDFVQAIANDLQSNGVGFCALLGYAPTACQHQTYLVLSTNPSTVGSGATTVTITATISSPAAPVGAPSIGGTVTFYDGATALCTNVFVSSGSASCSATISPGDVLSASYSGDSNYLASTDVLNVSTAACSAPADGSLQVSVYESTYTQDFAPPGFTFPETFIPPKLFLNGPFPAQPGQPGYFIAPFSPSIGVSVLVNTSPFQVPGTMQYNWYGANFNGPNQPSGDNLSLTFNADGTISGNDVHSDTQYIAFNVLRTIQSQSTLTGAWCHQ